MRKQGGQIIRIGDYWYVRWWERRNVDGTIQRKRVSHQIGCLTTRSRRPPEEIKGEAERFMATVNRGQIPAENILTIADFVESVYLPWIEQHQRPSTLKGYRQVWRQHLKATQHKSGQPNCGKTWLKNTRTYHVQGWLNNIAKSGTLSRNSLKRIQSVISGFFSLASQQGYYDGVNPAQKTRIDPNAAWPAKTYAYSLAEEQVLLALLPEPAATAFAVATFMGLRLGEIEGLTWEDYRDGEMHITRSIWNGHIGKPKTEKSAAPVPVIRQLAERLDNHRARMGNPQTGPIFANSLGKPLNMNNLLNRFILPALNRCARCGRAVGSPHLKADHEYQRDARLPQWHGWHAARRGLATNLKHMGVQDVVIQRILRHDSVSTTQTYYIKPVGDDVRDAMAMLEKMVPETTGQIVRDTFRTLKPAPGALPGTIN